MLNKDDISAGIAYITINPTGKFVKSAQLGMMQNGLHPRYMIHVSPKGRIRREAKNYRLGIIRKFLWPKFRQHFGNTKSFSDQIPTINIGDTIKVSKLNSKETADVLKKKKIKYLVNCGAGIFRDIIIDIPGMKIINAHAGRLPGYRNMNVVEWAIYNNDPVVGTIHLIDKGIDTGDVLMEREIDVTNHEDIVAIRESAFDKVIKMVGEVIIGLEEGWVKPVSQDRGGRRWYRMHPYFLNELRCRGGQEIE